MNNFRGDYSGISAKKSSPVMLTSNFVSADALVTSPQKLFSGTTEENIYWSTVPPKHLVKFQKQNLRC